MADTRVNQKRSLEQTDVYGEEKSTKEPTSKRARATQHQLQSGYDCIFVDELPDHIQIECSVCLSVLQDPQVVNCSCGSHFCQSCIEPIKKERKPCPLCKGKFTSSILDRQLQRTINSLQVYCSFKEAGCEWVGELKDLSGHLNTEPSNSNYKQSGCLYIPLDCSHCKQKFLRQLVLDHEKKECTKRPMCCNICGNYESTFEDVTNKHMPICESKLVPCPKQCGKSLLPEHTDRHLDTDCPLQLTQCLFSCIGCEEKIIRKDMMSHISQGLAYHLSLQVKSHKQLLEKVDSLQKIIEDKLTVERNNREYEINSLRDDVDDIKTKQDNLLSHSNIVPVRFVMTDFIAKRKAGEIWVSPPFYSRPRGHKMCLKVYTNGRNDGENTHLSVYIQIMRGEFDDELDWPFKGTLYIGVLDHGDYPETWTEKVRFDGDFLPGTNPQVRKGERNTELGLDKYLSVDNLRGCFYDLDNDSVFFEITEDSW